MLGSLAEEQGTYTIRLLRYTFCRWSSTCTSTTSLRTGERSGGFAAGAPHSPRWHSSIMIGCFKSSLQKACAVLPFTEFAPGVCATVRTNCLYVRAALPPLTKSDRRC